MNNPFEQNGSPNKNNSNTSDYSIDRLKQFIEKEDSKSYIQNSMSHNSNPEPLSGLSSLSNVPKSKPDLYSNIHKLLEENTANVPEIKVLHKPSHNINPPIEKYDHYINGPNHNKQSAINTADVLSMQLELQENKKTLALMKTKISELKSTLNKNELEAKEILSKKLNEQKFEHDNNIGRLNALIETLMSEKKKLNNNIDNLNEQISLINIQNQKKIQSLTDNHDNDNQRNKEAWFQAEKLRRKKWEDEKIKELKEITVRSLEPELDRMLKDHKTELSKQEEQLKDNFRNQKEKMIIDYEKKIKNLKESFAKEKENIQEEERRIYTKRLREQNERLEDEHSGEQKKWYVSLQEEITRLEQLRLKDKETYENDLELKNKRHNDDMEEKDRYYKQKINEFKDIYEEKIEKQIISEKQTIKNEHKEFIAKKEKEYEQRIQQTKEDMIKERDKKVNDVIATLSDDLIKDKNKTQIELERKAQMINECLKEENSQLKQTIQNLKGNEEELKGQLRKSISDHVISNKTIDEKIKEISSLKKEIEQLNIYIHELTDKYTNLQKTLNEEKINSELTYQTELHKSKKEYQLLIEKHELIIKGYESKLADIQKEHKAEMEDLENRISKTMKRKDETITRLNNDIQIKTQAISKYEELLTKQRNEFIAQYSNNSKNK